MLGPIGGPELLVCGLMLGLPLLLVLGVVLLSQRFTRQKPPEPPPLPGKDEAG